MKEILVQTFVALVVVSLIALFGYSTYRKIEITKGKKQVKAVCCALDSIVGENGLYVREEGVITDYWDNPLSIIYSPFNEDEMMESITVVSAGWDEEFGTSDDLYCTKTNLVPENVYRGFQNATRETAGNATRGIIDGILNYNNGEKE
jgi:hypothetical protein